MKIRIVGPSPGSSGGIGVMSSYLAATDSRRTSLAFLESGGAGGGAAARLSHFLRALRILAWGPGDDADVSVLELSSGGSTWRKLAFSWVLRLRRRPFLVHLHGGHYPLFVSRQHPVLQRAIRSMFTSATTVIVLGQSWAEFVREELGVPGARVVVLPNAVPGPSTVPARTDPVRVLFAGRVGTRKGVPNLLAAWEKVNWEKVNAQGNAVLVLAGDLDDPDGSIQGTIDSRSDVEYLGWLDASGLHEQMATAQVLALPSQVENLPLSLLEGMAWGLAPVVTPVGAVPEVIRDGQDGLLVPVDDVPALTVALERVLGDHVFRSSLAASGRRVWEQRYSLEIYRPRFDDIVEAAARDHAEHHTVKRARGAHRGAETKQVLAINRRRRVASAARRTRRGSSA